MAMLIAPPNHILCCGQKDQDHWEGRDAWSIGLNDNPYQLGKA